MSCQKNRLPYGVASFRDIKQGNFLFVDKTHFIKELEKLGSPYVLFLRPRRFGKTLLTTMLQAYYDRSCSREYERLFCDTWIYKRGGDSQGKYFVLRFDFSGIGSSDVVAEFMTALRDGVQDFFRRYAIHNSTEFVFADYASPAEFMRFFFMRVADFVGNNLYIIIDEYDQFANEILAENKSLFRQMTSADGFLKNFYSVLKSKTANGMISRIFMTGVTSVSVDSITSGFGIQRNISNLPAFADAAGFTEAELRQLISVAIDFSRSTMTPESLLARMKDYYNGYRFSQTSAVSVYNPSMCLYYLDAIQDTGGEPPDLFDPSFGIDSIKINNILTLADENVVRGIVEAATHDGTVMLPNGALSSSINLNKYGKFDRRNVLSILFYMGCLTFAVGSGNELRCPNKVMQEQFFEYFFTSFHGSSLGFDSEMLKNAFADLESGKADSLLRLVSEALKASSGLHVLVHFTEASLQMAVRFAMLTNQIYEVELEAEAKGSGYCDLLFRPKSSAQTWAASHLVELKYLKKSEGSEENVRRAMEEADEQLVRYAALEPAKSLVNLRKTAAVFVGLELAAVRSI